ncbi:hypothetical protein [Ramlibacter montanisoli]|uniref:hypothetical protein n=1 Tax=Ramlibacter montanisoli TaxID=2732512 RepID=UPI00209BEE3A|nr:hypothetical protein [Ramlibacter montanisoli]
MSGPLCRKVTRWLAASFLQPIEVKIGDSVGISVITMRVRRASRGASASICEGASS